MSKCIHMHCQTMPTSVHIITDCIPLYHPHRRPCLPPLYPPVTLPWPTSTPTPVMAGDDSDATAVSTSLAVAVVALLFSIAMTIIVLVMFYFLVKLRRDVRRLQPPCESLAPCMYYSLWVAHTCCGTNIGTVHKWPHGTTIICSWPHHYCTCGAPTCSIMMKPYTVLRSISQTVFIVSTCLRSTYNNTLSQLHCFL